jgi:hypothetical protein
MTLSLGRRVRLEHPGRNAFFDPDTLFMGVGADFKYTQFFGVDQAFLIDPATGSVSLNAFDSNVAQSYIHELHHWYQLTATTFGAFVLWLRYLRDRQFINAIRQFDLEDRLELRRVIEEGTPIIRINKDLNRVFTNKEETQLETALDAYYGRLLAEQILLGLVPADIQSKLELSVEDIVNSALNDVAHFVSADQSRRCLNVSFSTGGRLTDHIVSAPENDLRLDVWQIMECAAVFNEYDYLSYVIGRSSNLESALDLQRRAHEKRWSDPKNAIYKTAARLLKAVGGAKLDQEDLTNTVIVLCDVALNPPIPPITAASDGVDVASIDWAGVSPVARFVKCCHGIRDVGVCPPDADDARLAEYRVELCRKAELFHAESFPSIFDEKEPAEVPGGTGLVNQYYYSSYLMGAIQSGWRLRGSEGALVYAPGRPIYHLRHDFLRLFSNNNGFMTPILFKNPDGVFSFPLAFQDAAMDILSASFFHYSVQEWLMNGSLIDASPFPDGHASAESGVIGDAKRDVRQLFGDERIEWRV